MKRNLLFLLLALPSAFGFSWLDSAADTTPRFRGMLCPAPANVTVSSQSPGGISFDWDDCHCDLTAYKVFYTRGQYVSPDYSTGTSGISFSGLGAGTYDFHFRTDCGGEESGIIVIEDVPID